MINNIASMDMRPQMAVAKATPSVSSFSMPPILGFKTIPLKEKATIRVKKLKRGDNIAIPGIIEDDYVDVVDFDTITPIHTISGETLVAIAVYIGKTRLIDNFIVEA